MAKFPIYLNAIDTLTRSNQALYASVQQRRR